MSRDDRMPRPAEVTAPAALRRALPPPAEAVLRMRVLLPADAAADLSGRLSRLEAASREGAMPALGAEARGLERLARRAGHAEMARAAQGVSIGLDRGDAAALGATLARLVRLGEGLAEALSVARGQG